MFLEYLRVRLVTFVSIKKQAKFTEFWALRYTGHMLLMLGQS